MSAHLNRGTLFTSPNTLAGRRTRNGPAIMACAVAAVLIAPAVVRGQPVPLQDLVPLDAFEVQAGDLIDLATSQTDAVRELKTAQLSEQTLRKLQPNAAITALEMQIAQLNVQTAEQKVQILDAIAESQLATAQARLDLLQRIGAGQNGARMANLQTNPLIKHAEATVRILRMILELVPEPISQHPR